MKRLRLISILVFLQAANISIGAESSIPKLAKKSSNSTIAEIDFSASPSTSESRSDSSLKANENKSVGDTSKFAELQFDKTLVIEAKIERPQVQFPLLKEPPPEKDILFEASFREELLRQPRENTFGRQ